MDRYQEWLTFVFRRELTDPAWYFDFKEPDFEATAHEFTALITRTFRRSGTDLAQYSNDQVGQGLQYILSNSCSNIIFALRDNQVPLDERMQAVRSIKTLYSDCFNTRCTPALGHRSHPSANSALNFICYMLWDVSPVASWERVDRKDEIYPVVLEVLADALTSSNIACVESALHGLGHVYHEAPGAADVVRRFLRAPHVANEALLAYAEQAAVGRVL